MLLFSFTCVVELERRNPAKKEVRAFDLEDFYSVDVNPILYKKEFKNLIIHSVTSQMTELLFDVVITTPVGLIYSMQHSLLLKSLCMYCGNA